MAEATPYDKFQLHALFEEVQGYLAELRYIDTATSYLASEAANLASVGDQLLTPLPGRKQPFSVEFGRTHPFTRWYTAGDWVDTPLSLVPDGTGPLSSLDTTKVDRIETRLTELAAEADEWSAAQIDAIRKRVDPLTWPEGSLYLRECVVPLREALTTLEDEIIHNLGSLGHTITNWYGEAAENLYYAFYARFEETVRNQQRMLAHLIGGVDAAKVIAEFTQQSVMNVVHATKLAVLDQLELAKATRDAARRQSVQPALIVGGGIASVFDGILAVDVADAAGAQAGLPGGTPAGDASVAAPEIPPEAAEDYVIVGATAEALCASLSDAVETIVENDRSQHDRLRYEIDAALARLEISRDRDDGDGTQLIPTRPDLVDGVDGETFYTS